MSVVIEKVAYRGWRNNYRLRNGQVELIVTADVGPRVIRFAFEGARNVFGEMPEQMGGGGEKQWRIRGGHRLWIAPEAKPRSYEPDNSPVYVDRIPRGIRTVQPPGPVTGIQKIMELTLDEKRNRVTVVHRLCNAGRKPFELAPWALTVMAKKGMAIIPLPARIPHTQRLTHNQEWSLWGYTDFSDPRWTLGARHIFFRQDPKREPNKLGVAQREGWVAYHLDGFLFVKRFDWVEGGRYPDGGVNFETFANRDILELESLGPIVTLAPHKRVVHREVWELFRGVGAVRTEKDAERKIRPLADRK